MNHEETIFEQALGIGTSPAREEFLRGACEGNEAMLQRLQGLLRAHDRGGRFLEHDRPAAFGVPRSAFAARQSAASARRRSGGATAGPAEAGTPSLRVLR